MTKYETKVLQPEPKTYNTSFPATTCGVTEIKVYPQVEGIVTKKNYVPGTVVQKGVSRSRPEGGQSQFGDHEVAV